MKTKQKTYTTHFLINQNVRVRKFENIEKQASSIFLGFVGERPCGKSIKCFWFDVYVEPQVNYGQHQDSINLGYARLSAHIDKVAFDKANDNEKVILVLNCALVLTRYLAQKVVLPKDFDALNFTQEYEAYLSNKSLLLNNGELSKLIVKPFETTRFSFIITTTVEVNDKNIIYDLVDIENYINNKLAGRTFGDSIRNFQFGYEIFDFNGRFAEFRNQTANLRRYSSKYKSLLVVKQFDCVQLKKLDNKGQFGFLKTKILEAISDVSKLNKKPKDFDSQNFFKTVQDILAECEESKNDMRLNFQRKI